MAGLLQELLVCPERKISWVVDGDFQIIFQYNWMIGVIEWYIMSCVPCFWKLNPLIIHMRHGKIAL